MIFFNSRSTLYRNAAGLNGVVVAGVVRVRSELAVHLLPGEAQRSAEREGPVDQPQVEIEAQRRALERREGVHVERYGVLNDLVKELFTKLNLAVPQRALVGLVPDQNTVLSAITAFTVASTFSSS